MALREKKAKPSASGLQGIQQQVDQSKAAGGEEKEEEEEELFIGDAVRLSSTSADVKKALSDVGLQWEASTSAFLGLTGRVKTVQMKEGKQLVEVQFGSGADGPTLNVGAAALELLGDDEDDEEEDDDADQNEDAEDEAESSHVFRVNEKVRDITKPKGKCATGTVTKVHDDGAKCDVKYDDGGNRNGVPLAQLRPLEQAERDGTGLSYTSTFNEFDFTTGQLPTGVEAVGEGCELKPGRGGETYLAMRKGTFLRLPFKGMRHERLRPGEPIPSYTLTLEMQLDEQHPQLEHPWSVYQASFPEVHETDELSFAAKARLEFPQWSVGTDIDGKLPVTLEPDPKSKALAELHPGTVVQQCGDVVRLPSGSRRVPIKFKRQALHAGHDDEAPAKVPAPATAPGTFGSGKGFDLFKSTEEDEDEGGDIQEPSGHHGRMMEEEVVIELHAGYWGSSGRPGAATTVKVSSNGIARTLTFHPGVEGGAVRVEGEPDADVGFTPATGRYHILSLTMRQTGSHTFAVQDGADPTNAWSMEFRLQGWLDDLYGAAAVSVYDPEDRELEVGHEVCYQSEGEHKLRLVKQGDQVFETDELDPQGWVTFNRTCLEPVDRANTKASRHPTCHLKVKDKIFDKKLFPGRWHSLTVTVDTVRDEMTVYLDGQQVEKPIDIFETSMGRGGGGGDFGRRDRRKGATGAGAGDAYESYGYSGFGYMTPSPFAVPQEGFLLFASSSIRAMPGGAKLRKAIFRNSVLNAKAIEDQYVNSRHKRRPPALPQHLSLAPVMKKKAVPLWIHGSFVAEFCNPFVPAAGGSPLHLYGVFCMAMEAVVEKMAEGSLWTASEVSGCKKVLNIFRDLDQLMRKWHNLWTCEAADQLPGLAAIFLRRLAQSRGDLGPGGRLLVPLGIRLQRSSQQLMLIVERKASGNYRFVFVNSSPIGLTHHATDAGRPPKIRYRTALELEDIPAARAEDEGFWMMLVVTAVQPCSDGLALYDKLMPWLGGAPLEHMLCTASPSTAATAEWRSPQCAQTDSWRYLTFTMRVLLLEVAGFSTSKAKLLKWQLREQLLGLAATDLAQARSLSVSEKRLLRLGLSQLSFAAVKASGIIEVEAANGNQEEMATAKAKSMAVLTQAQKAVADIEAAIERKPRPYGFEDASILPLLDLLHGADEAPAEDWGLHPFFERLLREQRSPGQKVGIPLLVPINLLAMPEGIQDLEGAVRALRLAEELCAKLCFVGQERCKFSNFLRVALLQHVFTELVPLPLGPLAEKAPLNLTDPVWAPNGSDGLHPQLTRGGQLELMQVLLRLSEHFVSASCGLKESKGFDGVKIVVLGAIAAIADRVLRIRTVLPGIPKPQGDGPIEAEPEPNPSTVSELLNGVGAKNWKAMAVDPTSFMRQSETIEATTPEISVARTSVASYFTEVKKSLDVPSGKDRTLFDWDQHGWMMWVSKEAGLKKFVQAICATHLLQAGGDWAQLAAGADPYLVHTWPEFQCYRDIIFYWKYFLCTDLRVFPKCKELAPQLAYLKWQVVDEQKAYGCPPNRGKVFMVQGLGKDHLLKHDTPPHRPKPPASGLRWPSAALPSHHTKTPVRTEDDLLYMRTLPTFNEMLRASDAEALLSFLTVPYIRMPLVMAFFTTGDRVNSLFDRGLQEILEAVVLEPGKLLEPTHWSDAPENVPANSSMEQELVASPYGQLLTELSCAPSCLLAYLAKLLELALVLANSAMSQTVGTILFVLRVAARVESSAVYLLLHAEGKHPAGGPRPGALPCSAASLHELKAGRQRLRQIFVEAEGWLDAWLSELHGLAQKAAAAASGKGEEASGGGGGGLFGGVTTNVARSKAQQSLDKYMRTSCNIHAHILLLLRNVPEDELDERSVSRILSSFTFLSLHHTFNQDFLDIPETELFEVFQHHRRGLVRWFEKQRKGKEYGRFNRVLQEVHQQFSTIDSSSAVDTSHFEWGCVKGDARNAGRYAITGPRRSSAERGDVATTESNDNAWIELNIQLLQVTVRGRHVTPLETDTCDDNDFKEVLNQGAGRQAETVQCAALLSTNIVRVRELLSQPYRVTRWEGLSAAVLPFTGDYVRLYDMEDFEEHEAWVPQLFEPVRLKFFVRPVVPQDILFFLLEETDPSASVVVLAAVHPKVRGKVWKEVVLFRDLRVVQVFKIESYGHQHYRSLEYTTNSRYCLAEKQPSPNDRDDPWPDWGRYEAGAPDLNLADRPASVVMSRTIVKDTGGDGSAGAGSDKKDPLDDSAEWSDGEPSDDETEQEKKERTVWERSQKEGEQYLPKRLLKGLLPEGLLQKYFIYQQNESPWRAVRGYPKTPEGEEDRDPDHHLEIKLVKVGKVPATGHRGWCALVRKRWKAAGRKPWYLLNMLYAKEGTPLHSLARTLVRLEDLSFILAWTEQDPRELGSNAGRDPPIHLIEMPRLLLSFAVKKAPDGTRGLWSLDHAELSVPLGPPTFARTQAAKLLEPMPHSLLLQTANAQFFALLPNIKVHRPHVSTDPFSTELVMERGNTDWWAAAKNKTFLYPIHASRSFLQTPTLASALYMMMLRWMHRDYRGVAGLVSAVGTDSKFEDDEMQIFRGLGRITDPHPDSHANRLRVSLAIADANMELPWDLLQETAGYLGKLAHVSARSRLPEEGELRTLELCDQIRKCLEIIQNEVEQLRQRWWGQWGAVRLKRFVELLESEKERKLANFQEAQEVEQWLRQLLRKMRASQLPQTKEEIRSMALKVFGDYEVDPNTELALDNRSKYLERLGGRDGARPGEALTLHCPRRAKESLWQTHQDQNVLLCSLFDLLWEVLGAEKVLRRDVEEEEGPEIPMMRRLPFPMAISTAFEMLQGKMSLKDYGKAAKTWAFLYSLFTCSTGARLSRAKETQLSHQHTYSMLLLHLMPGSRHHGVLASLLHILAQNPAICEAMPLLTKPKKVRLVGQWKLKLTEIHQFVVQAADAMRLNWPPSPESFQELPRPMSSIVDPAWLQRADHQGGLCPRLLFVPELSREGACLLGCPSLAVLNCTERLLSGTADMSGEEAEALATKPLGLVAASHLVETPPSSLLPEEMPFDLSMHPTAKHRVAVSMLSRLDREVKLCARMRNARQKPALVMLQAEHVQAIANGDSEALNKARGQIEQLRQELLQLKAKDEDFVAMAISKSFGDANDIDLTSSSGAPLRDRLRFWLLRYADLEATLWFEHLCCGLLSPRAEEDFEQLNPFLDRAKAAGLLSRLTQMMLVAGRVIQTCRALDSCQDLAQLLANPASAGSAVALAAGLGEKANVLCGLLASKRTYIEKKEGSGGFVGSFDPHFLVFEFVTGFLLRPRQVEMVNEFSDALRTGKSSVKQMIMGAGKTSVVSPLLALMHANGLRIVCLVVPPALISLSRSVLQNCFSTVVQKRVSTFKCDRSLDLEVALSERLGRIVSHGDVLLTTPGDVKSLQLRFLEQLDLANDRQARRNTTQMRRECVQMGRALQLLKDGICMIDEVDLVLHPLRSELNFPIGPKNLIEHAPDRWRAVLHLLDGFFSVEKGRVPPHLKDSLRAKEILKLLGDVILRGCDRRFLQRNPHLILLNEDFYHREVKPIMCDWLMLWLSSEHVGRAFEQATGDREDRGLSEDEVRAYLLHRVTPQRLEMEAPLEVWQACLARAGGGSALARSASAWLLDVLTGPVGIRAGPGRVALPRPESGTGGGSALHFEPVARSEYAATRVEAETPGNVRVLFEETEEGATMRGERVEKLPAKDAKSMNLSWDWLQIYLPFSLQKIDRVTFGIMSSEQVAAALAEQPLMPLTRAKLAIPFVGKDVPSQSSEFAHPDVVIGLTILAYRYEGLRREDFDEVLGMLCDRLEAEAGAVLERPTSLLWRTWVEESGADFCVKQAELDAQTSAEVLGLEEGDVQMTKPDRLRPRVLPLHLLERRNEANMAQLFELLRKLPSAVHFYLEQSVFPQFMRFQDEKLSASGQDLGGSILFGQRIGFSGTPSDLMPRELGQCDYEPGSEGEMVSTMTDTQVVTFEAVQPGWNVELLLDSIIEAAHQNRCNALIDTGALITGLTNQEVAEYLLGFGRARQAAPEGSPTASPTGRSGGGPVLPDSIDGVVFLDDDGGKKILLRHTREVTKLADSGVPAQKRFAFYDQVHTTGMDIQHKLDAVAALTLGKDMCWRDYVQGAYRMRGIGRGQRICLYVIPEVVELISRDLHLAGIEEKLRGPSKEPWTKSEKGRLLAVAAWLLVNSIRTERIQFAMLQLQNLANVWRRNAFKSVMHDFEAVTADGLKEAVQVFKEPIAFTLPSGVPRPRGVHEVVEDRVQQMSALIADQDDQDAVSEVKTNVQELSKLADEKEGEAGLETEQQREQEQERQQEQEQEEEKEQEIEIEKFVDLMHCRDDEEPESWPLATLQSEEKAKQFYEAQRFKLWKRRPLDNLPEEARISTNWFNPQWSGFRRVKNVFVQMEWVPDMARAVRSVEPLQLDTVEEQEMDKKLRSAWDLLMRGEGLEVGSHPLVQESTLNRSDTLTVGKKVEKLPPPPGEIGAQRLMELLAASFDWDASLRDPAAALAILGRKHDEKLSYTDMVQLLLDGRFRTRDVGRNFVLLSLAEAETLRRILHARLQEGETILKQSPSSALALRCVFAGNAVLDASKSFQPGPTFQCRMLHQLARFLDGQSFYRPPEISVLLRALQRNRPFDRRRFFEGLGGCRRRGGGAAGGWEQQPVAEVLRPWLEFEQILARVRAVRLHAAIYGQGLSVQMAFQRFDVNQSGLLEPMELCRALRELGFAFDAYEVANWIEAVDTTGNHCADYAEFFAFCKLQVDALLGLGHVPTAALAADPAQLTADRPPAQPEAPPEPERIQSANPPTSEQTSGMPSGVPPQLYRHTSDIVRPDEIEEELLERRAQAKRHEAEEARAKAEVEEAIEVLVEEELGMNPAYGEGYGEWDFRGQLLPKDTFALGVVDLIPESWGTKGGKNFLLFDARAGLAVQRVQLAPNGNSDRRINKYSLTMWFRIPMLPSKADRMLLIDLPRGEMDSELVDESSTGGGGSSIFVWRGGVLAPEGYHEPSLQKKDTDASARLRQMVNGEWHLKFSGRECEKKAEVLLTMEPSGRLLLSPSRGAASRKKADGQNTRFGVRLKMAQEVREYVENYCDGVVPQDPDDFQRVLDHYWGSKIRPACNIATSGRSWAEIGWPGSQNQCKRRAAKDLKSRGDVLIARGLPALDALRIARSLKEFSQAGAEFVEDKSLESEIKTGDMVQKVKKTPPSADLIGNPASGLFSSPFGGSLFGSPMGLEDGEAGKVTNINHSRGQVHVESKRGGRWYGEDEVVKVDPKALGLVPLTDSEWAGLPSTRANYVAFSQQLPNPLMEAGWQGKGRAEKAAETSAAEVDLNFDVVAAGFMSSYVDAHVAYAESGLEITGEWRTADGSSGTLTGTKALAGLALGGLWHLELQTGADSMQHAWNCWFSCFPPSSGGNTSMIRVSGSALAGPLLQEGSSAENAPPALQISGEMSGKGVVSFTISALEDDLEALDALSAKNWVGSVWEGELGPDRWLRGSWRKAGESASGRWRARHIGRAAVHNTLKPQVDSGAEWEAKRCEIRTAPPDAKTAGRLKKGMKVKLSKVYKTCSDAPFGPLKEGQVGEIIQENPGSDQPVNVKGPGGGTWWYQEKALVPAFALHDDSRIFNPLGDEFEGISFTRFPITQGSAYAEFRVVRLGRTQPIIGLAVMEEKAGKTILTRMAVIEGRTARKVDLSKQPEEEVPETPKKEKAKPTAKAGRKKSESDDEENVSFDLFGGGGQKEEPDEEEEEEKEQPEGEQKKGWDLAKPYGDRWQEGDVICCQVMMPGGVIAFGLNGDFQAPMGVAFDLNLPKGTQLCLVAAAGENGRLRVNLGTVAFAFPPPNKLDALLPDLDEEEEEPGKAEEEGGEESEAQEKAEKKAPEEPAELVPIDVPPSQGVGQAMKIRPLWQVKLPKAVKAWPVYAAPSRESQGRRAMKDGEVVEQVALDPSGAGWVQHQAGWSPCRMVVVGHEYEALKPTPAWVGIDKPPKEKKVRKTIQRLVHATMDAELCSQHNWNFRGADEAQCSNGPTMLVSAESAAAGVLRWCIKSESGNKAIEVGVIPADKAEEGNFLFEGCDCGVKSTGTKGGSDKTVFDIYMKYIEVIADLDARTAKVMVGDSREQMVEVKSMDIPFEDDVKLAITGWNNTKVRLEAPMRDKLGDSDESDGEEEDSDGPVVTSCGNAVQAATWHVATMVVDLPASKFQVYLDGELHLSVRDPGGLVADGRFSIDPREGLMLFSAAKRGGSGVGSADWRAGGHLRSMRLDTQALTQFDVWTQQLPKGIWICRCTARNAADARICWRCRNTRTRSGVRPPGDADPRVEGLTVITADSFRELVLESQKHVLVVASASWCGPCQQLKPRIHRLAQLLAAEASIAVGVIDTDENELQSRYFPEPHIPNVKLFLQGNKRQPVAVTNASGMSLDELAGFLEQQTGVSIQKAIEKGYPAYAERIGVDALLTKLKQTALSKPIPRAPGQPGIKALATFLYHELLTDGQASVQEISPPRPQAADSTTKVLPQGPPVQLRRAISAKAAAAPTGGPPMLMRAVSGGGQSQARHRVSVPNLALGMSDKRLTERLLEELFEKHLLAQVRVAQPEEFKAFVKAFLLKVAQPTYSHSIFFNARTRVSWQMCPEATQLVAAARILRFLLRWATQRRALNGLPPLSVPWAPPPAPTEMSAAAQRHSWRRIEMALANEEHKYGLAELGLLLDRGLPPDTCPFGITPLLLAATIGHLTAAQFLFVRGASPHVLGGQPPMLPVEAAARHNHLRIVELLLENGSVAGRALHFAAAGGSTDVATFLLAKNCSADAVVSGLSPVAVALASKQHSMASLLLPHCTPTALQATIQDDGCASTGLAPGSTLAHLAASVGGLCEGFVLALFRLLPLSASVALNNHGKSPLDLMSTTLRMAVKPQLYAALGAAAEAEDAARAAEVAAALAKHAHPAASDARGFNLLDLAAFQGDAGLVDTMLTADSRLAQSTGRLSSLMWAHWCGQSEVVLKLTSRGSSLSNADLEGLQLLRAAGAELSDGAEEKEKAPGVQLLWPEVSQLWLGCWLPGMPKYLSPSVSTYLHCAKGLLGRMTWGAGQDNGTAMPTTSVSTAPGAAVDEEEQQKPGKVAAELLQALKLIGPDKGALASAQLLALRLTAEGKVGLSPANVIALNLFLSDATFHSEVNTAMVSQFSQQPLPAVRERAADIYAAHAQLSAAIQALPARKVVCFRSIRFAGGMRDFLRGHRLGMDCYRPGSIVMWRHAASCTQDPALAEELALHGEPASASGVVFKIRRAASARPVADFSATPEHQEVLFAPGTIFRVVGFYPCNQQSLRKGTASDAGAWSAELGSAAACAAQRSEALAWEEVCRSRSAMVLLDEEDAGAAQRADMGP